LVTVLLLETAKKAGARKIGYASFTSAYLSGRCRSSVDVFDGVMVAVDGGFFLIVVDPDQKLVVLRIVPV